MAAGPAIWNAIYSLLGVAESLILIIPNAPRKSCFFAYFCVVGTVKNKPGGKAQFLADA
jgi:hypothetical protein